MSRKFFYSFKYLICVLLVSSLILPVYAENAASDGSAFVTKEEFDKALADFNSRLTSFEAGINSKIDSQVSSYLDRNGIWAGRGQIVKDNPEQTYGFKIDTTIHNGYMFGVGEVKLDDKTYVTTSYLDKADFYGVLLNSLNDGTKWNQNEEYNDNGVLVESVTKSGLLFMPLHDVVIKNDDIRCRLTHIGSWVIADDVYRGTYTAKIQFNIGDENKWSKDLLWVSQAAGVALCCPAFADDTVLFFVSKGDKIEWKWKETWTKNAVNDYATSLGAMTMSKGRQTIRKFSFEQPMVY